MEEVSLFFFLFFAGALILTFWIVPGGIAAFTPFKYKEVLRDLKSALVIVEALAAAHPGLIAVVRSDVGNPYLLAYLMPPGAEEFENFVSYWLNLKRTNGFEARQRAFWVERIPRADPTPRWSILRNVFGLGSMIPASGAHGVRPDDT